MSHLSFNHKYTASEALEGAKVFYDEFTGHVSPVGDLALAGCAILDYGVGTTVPVTEGMRKVVAVGAMSAEDCDNCKQQVVDILRPHFDKEGGLRAEDAEKIDWGKLAGLIAKLLPIILPLIV